MIQEAVSLRYKPNPHIVASELQGSQEQHWLSPQAAHFTGYLLSTIEWNDSTAVKY